MYKQLRTRDTDSIKLCCLVHESLKFRINILAGRTHLTHSNPLKLVTIVKELSHTEK